MKEKGSALAEAAIVIPLLLFLFIGLVDVGLLINTKIVANEAARAAAREYAGTGDEAAARSKAAYLSDLEDFKLVQENPLIHVEAAVPYSLLFPGVWKLFGDSEFQRVVIGSATFWLEPE